MIEMSVSVLLGICNQLIYLLEHDNIDDVDDISVVLRRQKNLDYTIEVYKRKY